MTTFSRLDKSVVGNWWWTVDRWTLVAVALLLALGAVMVLAASPAIATRLGLEHFHFVRRQFMYLPLAVILMFGISLLSPIWVRRLAVVIFIGCVILTLATLLVGPEVKGAKRWLQFGSFTLQPTEFLKPAFAVVAAWMFSEQRRGVDFPGNWISVGLYGLVMALLLAQPDVGMSLVVSAVWFAQFFMAGCRFSGFWRYWLWVFWARRELTRFSPMSRAGSIAFLIRRAAEIIRLNGQWKPFRPADFSVSDLGTVR